MSASADTTGCKVVEYEEGKEYGATGNKPAWPTFALLKLLMNSTVNKFHFHQKWCTAYTAESRTSYYLFEFLSIAPPPVINKWDRVILDFLRKVFKNIYFRSNKSFNMPKNVTTLYLERDVTCFGRLRPSSGHEHNVIK